MLTTSRAPLRIRFEREWPVPPLPIPEQVTEAAGDASLAALEENPSVALFVDRARAARPAWSITRANAPAVAEIARRLEGLPLAIELAAARIRVLTPADIVKRLGGALNLLAARAGDRPDRQQTLRAAIAWSHDLLSFENQAAFRRLGVFSGGFMLEAAETILAASPDPWVDGLDAVSILVEQNLIRAEEAPNGESRYRMLETIRAFALEALDDAGEGEAVRKAHAVWAEAFARDADSRVSGPDSAAWLGRYEREHDNVRAALAWAIEHDPDYLGLRIPEALWQFWSLRGHYAEARTWIERSLAASSDALPKLRALALDGLGIIAWNQGELLVATTAFNEALATWRETGERRNVSGTLSNLGGLHMRRGDYEQARAMHEEALTIVRELNDPPRVATVLNNLATAVWNTGDAARATALLEESVASKRKQGNLIGLASSLSNLGMLAAEAGDLERAIAYMEETLAIDREVGNLDGIADSLHNLASLVADQDDIARAAAFNLESLELRYAMGDRVGIAYNLENIAATVARAGRCQAAARLFGAAERLREDLGAPLPPSERERYEEGVSICRDAGASTRLDGDWETGRGLAFDDAVAEALHVSRELAGTAAQGSGNLSATTTSE